MIVMGANAMFVSTQLATSLSSFLTLTAMLRLLFVQVIVPAAALRESPYVSVPRPVAGLVAT